ncbi:MAG: DUF1045 domain-containing protein [Pseudomonadota bacterium]
MHQDYEEFAIYWIPRTETSLSVFGAGWTGWCADRGTVADLPEIRRLRRGRQEAPGSGAVHGLHAALSAPFRLARGKTVWALDHDLMALAQMIPAIRLPRFEVTVLDGRVVLALSRPSRPVSKLTRFVAEVVRDVRKEPGYISYHGTSTVAGIYLPGMAAWSDAGATEAGRFHIALTDRMGLADAFDMVDELTPALDEVLVEPQLVADLVLMGNPGRGRPWRMVERYPLAEEPRRQTDGLPRSMTCRGPRLWAPLDTGLAIV